MSIQINKDITTVQVEIPKTNVAIETAITEITVQTSQPEIIIATAGVQGPIGPRGFDTGTSGTSGTSGVSGSSGTSGTSGSNGITGAGGSNGTSGTSGVNGTFFGSSGTSGVSGSSGTSGVSGSSGTSGVSGSSGTSGLRGDSLFALTGSKWATTNTIEITGSLTVSSSGTFTNIGPANFIGNQTITGSLNLTDSVNINSPEPKPLSIGDSFGGGKLAYILTPTDAEYDSTLIKGIVAATADEATTQTWTNAITASNNKVENGYDDWYLPSKDELNKLYLNKDAIGGFVNATYWSSTQSSSTLAWFQIFSTGTQTVSTKTFALNFRAIRAFSIPKNALNVIGNTTITGSLNVSSSIISSDKVDAPNINLKGGNISFDTNGAGILHTGQFNITTVFEDNELANTWTFNQYGTLTTPGDIVITGSLNVSSSIILANGARISDNVDNALAFGLGAGIEQQNGAIAIGDTAGLSQGYQAIAIGTEAAGQGGFQSEGAIAIGTAAGGSEQGLYAIAIGSGAGQVSQSIWSVAIGYDAGRNSQTQQTIILNATGTVVDSIAGQSGSFYVAPIRKATGVDGILQYNSSSREVTYSNSISGSISITGSLTVSSSGTFTNIGPANFIGNQTISGSLNVSGGLNITNNGYSWSFESNGRTKLPNITFNSDRGTGMVGIKPVAGREFQIETSTAVSSAGPWVFGLDGTLSAPNGANIMRVANLVTTSSFNNFTGSVATTGSNQFNGNQNITGSLNQGLGNIALGEYSHAEGDSTQAIGLFSHAEGLGTIAYGGRSHAEGRDTLASGSYSHAEGYQTIALGDNQHVQGQYNFVSPVQSAFIVGNGIDDSNRNNLIYAAENAVEISGSLNITGSVKLSTPNQDGDYLDLIIGQTNDLGPHAYQINASGSTENALFLISNLASVMVAQGTVSNPGDTSLFTTQVVGYVNNGGPEAQLQLSKSGSVPAIWVYDYTATSNFPGDINIGYDNIIGITSGSLNIRNGNINLSGSINVTGSFTASLREGYVWVGGNTGKNTLQIATSSFGVGGGADITLLNNYTGSSIEIDGGLMAYTASLKAAAIISSSAQITALGFGAGGSDITLLNQFSGSVNTYTGSNDIVVQRLMQATASLNTYTGSNDSVVQRLMQATASINITTGSLLRLYQTTASLNTYTGSNDSVINRILQTTASLNTLTGSVSGIVNNLMSYTASLKAAAIVSSSTQVSNYFVFAQTSSANTFYNNQTISGSLFVSSTAISNATLLASSSNLTLSSGSNLYIYNGGFADISGSLRLTGSLSVGFSAGTSELQVLSTGVNIGNISTDRHLITGSLIVSASTNLTGSVTINESRIDNAWTSYTPTWEAPTPPAIGNGTITGAYKVIGKTCFVRGSITMGSTTTYGSGDWKIGLPVAAINAYAIQIPASLLDGSGGTGWYNALMNGAVALNTISSQILANLPPSFGGSAASGISSIFPFTWGSGDALYFNGSYEIA